MKNEIVKVGFHGGEIEAVKKGKDIWVSVRRACESLGIDVEGQRQKLSNEQRAPWAVTCMIKATGSDGKNYNQFMLHVDALAMWLATIDIGRVAEDVRPLLIAYQKEAAQVLRDHFFKQGIETLAEKEARLQAKEDRLTRAQCAKGWRLAKEIAEKQCRPGLVAIYDARLAEILAGEQLPDLMPKIDETAEWKFPEQIAQELGVSWQMVGRVISELWGKGRGNIEGIREVRIGTAPRHHKMIEQCVYSPEAVKKIETKVRMRLVK